MLAYYFSILRRRAWLVALETAVLAPMIFLALTAGPTTYMSEAVVQVGTGTVTDGVIDTGRSFEDPDQRIATELEVLTGRAVAEDAVLRLRAQGWDVNLGEVMTAVEAAPRGGASAIEVVGTDPDPVRAQQLTAAFVNSYMDYRREQYRGEAERVQADLRGRLEEAAAAQDSQARYDTLAEWLENVTLRLSVDTSGLELISPPSLPEEPTRAVSPAVAAVASVVGALALGCALALALDLVRDSVRTRDEAEILLSTPALVEMPRLRERGTWTEALSDASHPTSSAARGLRLRLGSSLLDAPGTRIMVAGTRGEGRDTLVVASALAAAYGRSDSLVLLVADPLEDAGLDDITASGGDGSVIVVDDAPEVRATRLSGVWHVPATTSADGRLGVLDLHDPAQALDAYGRSFDVVVLAIPPTADEAEAVAVGLLVQASVVVCALGRTPTKRLRRLVTSLRSSGVAVSGLALTTRARRGHSRPVGSVARTDRLPVRAA